MQFIDQARIVVHAGRGGDGIVAFRREKYVPTGGPSGGDGGRGGDIILEADRNLQTLLDFKYKRIFPAESGKRGGPNNCSGVAGSNLIIKVPCGTEVRHLSSGILLGDLTEPGQQLMVARGGRGGLGNAHYLSNRNRVPEKFTEGRDGEEWPLQLELKLLAEVGIIGLPNAGKSTLISLLSAAKPKIASYPFTTILPNLGVVHRQNGSGTVFADIPGLILGAARGIGLGYDFLRHIQRTCLLVHLIDCQSDDIIHDFIVIEGELTSYGHGLIHKPRILVLHKIDLLDRGRLGQLCKALKMITACDILLTSSTIHASLEFLKMHIWQELDTTP
uniref:GTP1/Obg family GTP-binding protein n=1 Tax=Paulinella micropora TaxID=1928728 RepID=A0A385I0Z7_9EUKA|nr:GTP1/Obg family GTP-binding protein [Paulinella micropora]AXY63596.1 GTP1/Obg family GTP-binding protein [Paulinella micropora]